MIATGNYKDLLELINVNENILNNCKKSYREIEMFLVKQGMPSGYPSGTSYLDADNIKTNNKDMSLDALIGELGKLDSMIYLQESILENLYASKKNFLDKLKGLTGLDYRVVYLRDLEKMNLQQIAYTIGYSVDRIKQISARNKREEGYSSSK